MSQSVRFGKNDVDPPAPRGPSKFDEPPAPEWIARRLESALRIDRSFHVATTMGVSEIRDVAACAVHLAKALATIRDIARQPYIRCLADVIAIAEAFVGPNPEKPHGQG